MPTMLVVLQRRRPRNCSELKQHESTLESLEQQCANIRTVVYQFEEARNQFFAAALAQLNETLNAYRIGIDSVVIQTMAPGSGKRENGAQVLTQRVSSLRANFYHCGLHVQADNMTVFGKSFLEILFSFSSSVLVRNLAIGVFPKHHVGAVPVQMDC